MRDAAVVLGPCLALSMRLARSITGKSRLLWCQDQNQDRGQDRDQSRDAQTYGPSPAALVPLPSPLSSPLSVSCSCTDDAKWSRWTHKVGVAALDDWIGLAGGAEVAHASAVVPMPQCLCRSTYAVVPICCELPAFFLGCFSHAPR